MRLEAVFSGGGQERGLRSGTVPAPLAVGLGAACEIAQEEMARDAKHIAHLERILRERIPVPKGDPGWIDCFPDERLQQRWWRPSPWCQPEIAPGVCPGGFAGGSSAPGVPPA